jgi:hypothetical protein
MNTIMDSSTLYSYLSSIHEEVETFEVTEEFIEFRDKMKDKFRANGREEWRRTMHADCLAIEYQLLKKKLVEKPENIYHDFIVEGTKVDCKIITSKYFNVPEDKVLYYMENLRSGNVTHFAFYKFYPRSPEAPLKAGDVVQFKLCEVQRVERIMNSLSPSNYKDGYYYNVRNV